jgi:hypothetical protein
VDTSYPSLLDTYGMAGSTGIPIRKPARDVQLAELIGIMMGDGGMSLYQATITLHHVDDSEYCGFVADVIKRLFGYKPDVHHLPHASVLKIVMSRVELVRYLHTLGLPMGDKIRKGLDIPRWIKTDDSLLRACIRGLIDTDGSVFTHRYISKGKLYSYKKLSFTTASTALRLSVRDALVGLGVRARIGSNNDVRLDSSKDMRTYFSLIGTHNPKHLRRYLS